MELSTAQYNQLRARVNVMPWQQMEPFLSWTYNGRPLSEQDFPDAQDERKEKIREHFRIQPNQLEQQEWELIQPFMDGTSFGELDILMSKLSSYISNWEHLRPFGNHVDEAKILLQEKEEALWNQVDIFNIDSLVNYYRRYPSTVHKNEIDDSIYNLSNNTAVVDVIISNMNRYLSIFPDGLHKEDAQAAINSACKWMEIKNEANLYSVHLFIKDNPKSIFLNEARILLHTLKSREIERMKNEFNDYSRMDLMDFIKHGIFTEHELIMHGVATERSIEILNNYEQIQSELPKLDDVIPKCTSECYPEHTDVFMFGIPATGKSCVLAGLFGSGSLIYNSVLAGGAYADALIQFMDCNCPPDPTKKNYLTTIKSEIREGNQTHMFDLVEMAGEEFADKIAHNPEGIVKFEDMGTGAAELLRMPNRKIFFIIVDPTKNTIRFTKEEEITDENGNTYYQNRAISISQKQSLKRMIDMFTLEENQDIMEKVDAIHFIVTKADTLGEAASEREEKAVDLLQSRYRDTIQTLTKLCKDYGINRRTNHRPHVFTFSLGQFYVGNIFEYDNTDSNSIIDVLKASTVPVADENFWHKLRRFLNGGGR